MAKQPAATGTGFLQAFLALIIVAAIGVGVVMATTNIAWS
jgi:archaellin